ncbi:MAG TPA: MoaD/ThiS family protein [Methanocorpusculum sp.]|nr:MoaD/ThiS family protein [Candidatus Methanocorpusculum faecipullorum]HJK03357.1 MoaD/ThiS family protein [Methanocorpusculum sp.]HJK05700.1 MoaD/ThiS family protein [Methanocorpusculum sp.]HJK13709.1 MoaD/ThiS family protein [Methanocorpusculum sp.]HJK17695.1 MoaD/ThiS family protein [Methanocorpusculum sp.]
MSEITILAFASFREKFGEKNTVTISNGATILSVLHSFAESVPAARDELFDGDSLRGHVILMYNRERIDADDAKEIAVSDGDEIVLYPPVSGG